MSPRPRHVVNIDDVEEIEHSAGTHWRHTYKPLTPTMPKGRLSANLTRVPPGRVAVPFHTHQLEDELFYVLEGRGVVRYGDTIEEIRPGDCVACPAGSGVAHQLANPFDDDLVYLAIGSNDPNEVCTYPDSDKVFVRSLKRIGYLEEVDRFHGEPEVPAVFSLLEKRAKKTRARRKRGPRK